MLPSTEADVVLEMAGKQRVTERQRRESSEGLTLRQSHVKALLIVIT